MLKRSILLIVVYCLPNILTSCIDCGVKPKNYLKSTMGLEIYKVSSLEETLLQRYESYQGPEITISFFALKLGIELQEKKPISAIYSGYNCFACSYAPPFLASEISNISIQFSEEFEGKSSGENLRDFFKIDPLSNYYPPYKFMSIDKFENAKQERSAEAIYFIFSDSLINNYEGIFTIRFDSDGSSYQEETELVKLTRP